MRRKRGPNTPLSAEDIAFIREHHKQRGVAFIARKLRRAYKTIYDYLDDNNLSVHREFQMKRVRRVKRKSDFFDYDSNCLI